VKTRIPRHLTSVRAVGIGLLLTVVYGAFEFAHFGIPERIAIGGDTNAISVFHFPLIWLLSASMLYGLLRAVDLIRNGRVKDRPVVFALSIVGSVSLSLLWAVPLVNRLTKPVITSEASVCTTPVAEAPMTGPAIVRYSEYGFCPVEVRIGTGQTVTFAAAGGTSMRIASEYPAFNQNEAGPAYSFTFTEPGTYVYRDSPSEAQPFRRFLSELFGKTRMFQGRIKVTR